MKQYKVSKDVALNIVSVKDLNDFYAYVERNGDNYYYDFPEEVFYHIDSLMDDLNYAPGVYDKENIKRIFNIK